MVLKFFFKNINFFIATTLGFKLFNFYLKFSSVLFNHLPLLARYNPKYDVFLKSGCHRKTLPKKECLSKFIMVAILLVWRNAFTKINNFLKL